jgi:hypothetical protein
MAGALGQGTRTPRTPRVLGGRVGGGRGTAPRRQTPWKDAESDPPFACNRLPEPRTPLKGRCERDVVGEASANPDNFPPEGPPVVVELPGAPRFPFHQGSEGGGGDPTHLL